MSRGLALRKNAFKYLTMKNPCFAVSDYASFGLRQLAFLICSIWLCRKLLCFTYLLATGSGAYHFRQRRSRHRRRKLHPPEAKGQRCGELTSRLSSHLTFTYLCVVIRAIHSSRRGISAWSFVQTLDLHETAISPSGATS